MNNYYNPAQPNVRTVTYKKTDDRSQATIGPALPFIAGALVGSAIGGYPPNYYSGYNYYGYSYPAYPPVAGAPYYPGPFY